MVPPRRRMPVTSLADSTRDRFGSIRPSKLSSRPTTSMPLLTPALTTARITAFRPGASPPPVRIPIRFSFCMQSGYSGGPAAGSVLHGPDTGRSAGAQDVLRNVEEYTTRPEPLPRRECAWYSWGSGRRRERGNRRCIRPIRAASSAGRAPRSQRGGREFDPRAVHQIRFTAPHTLHASRAPRAPAPRAPHAPCAPQLPLCRIGPPVTNP